MNIIKYVRNVVLFYLAIILVNAAIVFAQGGGAVLVPTSPDFNWLFLIPIGLGNVVHWFVKWSANRVTTPSFWSYILDNGGATFAGVMVGWGAVWAQFLSNPVAFASFNLGSFMAVLMTVWAGDTLNSNFSKRTAPPSIT